MKKYLLYSLLIFLPAPLLSQSTSVTATITDSTGQVWFNGSYSVTFVPNPSQPGQYYWQDAPFVPQKYTGTMNGSGTMSLILPDSNTISPAGSQWAFVLCANTSAACSTVTIPVTGATENLSSIFSSRVIPPLLFSSPMPRAYSSAEVQIPPPNQGGQFYDVTQNLPFFWNGTAWFSLGGTVTSVALGLPASVFSISGSPVTSSGTLTGTFIAQSANTLFANCTGSSAVPTFCQLTAAMVAPAGTLSNNTSGNANTATTAGTVAGGYVASIIAGTGIGVSPGGGQGNVTVSNTGVTGLTAGPGINLSASTGNVTVSVIGTSQIQAATAAGCITGTASFNVCSTTVTWTTPFVDTNYSVNCTGVNPNTDGSGGIGRTKLVGVTTKGTGSVIVATGNDGTASNVGYGEIDCVGVHP